MSIATAIVPAPSQPDPVPGRLTWIDTFRGLSIAMVVLGHVLGGLAFAAFVPDPARQRLWDAYDLIYTFRMPALFLASGLFAARSIRKGLPVFLGDKARTLAYPYLVWSLLGWLCLSAASQLTNSQADPLAPLKMLYDPMLGVWFLYVLFAMMIGFGLWTAGGGSRRGFLAVAALTHLLVPMWEGAPSLLVQVARYVVYFGLGIVLADHVRMIGDRLTARRLLVLVPSAFALMKAAVAMGWAGTAGLVLVPALCGTAGMFGAAMLLDRLPGVEALRHFGRHSLQIYVAGGHASVATRILLNTGAGLSWLPAHIALGTIAGLTLPLVLVAACRAVGFRHLFAWPRPSAEGSGRVVASGGRGPTGRRPSRVVGVPAP